MKSRRRHDHVSIRAGQGRIRQSWNGRLEMARCVSLVLGLSWPQFAAFVASLYIGLNLLFAAL
jgi:hypothetical protein